MGKAMMVAAALLLAGCTSSGTNYAAPRPPQRMDPNTAAMIWMMYSNQMTDDVMRARQAPPAQRYCYQSGGMAWCQ